MRSLTSNRSTLGFVPAIGSAVALLLSAAAMASSAARADDGDLRSLQHRPALMARSRALSKPVVAPQAQAAPPAQPRPKPLGGAGDGTPSGRR